MSNRFLRLNRVSAVLIITFCAVMISVLVTTALLYWLGPEQANVNHKTALIISASVPLVAAPITSWPVMGLLIKIRNLESEMRQLANSDALTGLANRRHFFALLNNQLKISTPSCLLMLDIDFFKRINDQFGHQQGDTALIALAQQLRGISQQIDCPARIGGEEFALLMANTDLPSAEQRAVELHQQLAYKADTSPSFTISIGLCQANPDESLEELMRRADSALYKAKLNGRNQTQLG